MIAVSLMPNVASDCSSGECKEHYLTLKVTHDKCDHDALSRAAEEGLHDWNMDCMRRTMNQVRYVWRHDPLLIVQFLHLHLLSRFLHPTTTTTMNPRRLEMENDGQIYWCVALMLGYDALIMA